MIGTLGLGVVISGTVGSFDDPPTRSTGANGGRSICCFWALFAVPFILVVVLRVISQTTADYYLQMGWINPSWRYLAFLCHFAVPDVSKPAPGSGGGVYAGE